MNFPSLQKTLLIGTLGLILILLTGYRLIKPDIFSNRSNTEASQPTLSEPAQKEPVADSATSSASEPAPVVSTRMSLSGTIICLPHIDQSTQTKECAIGLKTNTDTYYSLDFNLLSSVRPDLRVGEPLNANGIFTPIEMLSSEFLRKTYPVRGIFSVTDLIR